MKTKFINQSSDRQNHQNKDKIFYVDNQTLASQSFGNYSPPVYLVHVGTNEASNSVTATPSLVFRWHEFLIIILS